MKKQASKKKPNRKAMPRRKKILVAGLLTTFVLQAIGWPTAARLGWKASQAQQLCIAEIQEKADAISRGSQATGDSVADAALARAAAKNSALCQSADAAYHRTSKFISWMMIAAVLSLVISASPSLYAAVRWINNPHRPISPKRSH